MTAMEGRQGLCVPLMASVISNLILQMLLAAALVACTTEGSGNPLPLAHLKVDEWLQNFSVPSSSFLLSPMPHNLEGYPTRHKKHFAAFRQA